MKKVFIDGSAGTTGLRIYDRIAQRNDLTLLTLCEEERKDPQKRKEMLNMADIAFLCLPDEAAIEAVSMIENENTVVLDTSTAHRTAAGWTYGFPELSQDIARSLKSSKRIAVPGCHASGFVALIRPLIESRLIPKSAQLTCHSLTGYSGGGKKMIAEYNSEAKNELLSAPRIYSLSCNHKHLKEMKAYTELDAAPIFCPIVSDFYSGMLVTVPLFKEQLASNCGIDDIKKIYSEKYNGKIVKYKENADENGFISAAGLSGSDSMEISVFGCDDRILLMARYDNLGKGASGAAVEAMNYRLGLDITTGLTL